MSFRTRTVVLLASTAIFALSACKASKEDEIKAWNANSASITSLSGKYPQFAALLKARLASQQKAFDAAKAKDGKDAVEAMGQANKAVRALLGPLETYESKRARIIKLYNDYKVRSNKGYKVRDARDKADKKLRQAAEVIMAARPQNDAEMLQALTTANGYLREGLEPLEKLKRKGGKKTKWKKKKEKH